METIEAINRLNKIFRTKDWRAHDNDDHVWESFCILLDKIEPEQRLLMIELSERYKWIPVGQYQEHILAALDIVEEEKLKQLKTIYFFPIGSKHDREDFKSGRMVATIVKCSESLLKRKKKYEHLHFTYVTGYTQLSTVQLTTEGAFFLLDDYVGSGETVNNCLNQMRATNQIPNNKLNVVSIATQAEVRDQLIDQGISFYAAYISNKGISDYYNGSTLTSKKETMLRLERLIPAGSSYSFGYKATEALITVARTPDNTFPIFWKKHKISGRTYDAPFLRESITEL
jgi:hypothetical protein